MKRFLYALPLLLLLSGCAGLIPRLPDGSLDTERVIEIASTAAESVAGGVELAAASDAASGDWIGYGVGTLLSLAVAALTGKAGHALWRSGRST